MKIEFTLTQYTFPGPLSGKNGFYGSINIPPNIFLTHISVRNADTTTAASGDQMWTFPNTVVSLKTAPEEGHQILFQGSISNAYQYTVFDDMITTGDFIPLSKPIEKDSSPILYIVMEETATDTTYSDVVAEIHYSPYLHPVSHSSVLAKLLKTDDLTFSTAHVKSLNIWEQNILLPKFVKGTQTATSATILTVPGNKHVFLERIYGKVDAAGTWSLEIDIQSTDYCMLIAETTGADWFNATLQMSVATGKLVRLRELAGTSTITYILVYNEIYKT